MIYRLPGKLSEMDKAAHFTWNTQFQALPCFSLLHFPFHTDILSYKIPSAIKNKLMTLHLILTPMTNQCKIETTSRTKNRISNFHKITSSGISILFFFQLEVFDERSLGVQTSHHLPSSFQLVPFFIYVLKGIDFLPSYFIELPLLTKI